MNRKPPALRAAAGLLAATLLAGCSSADDLMQMVADKLPDVQKNQTISDDSKWINSTIDGAIDADTPTNVKDDFYTAVNKDWLLEPLPEGTDDVSAWTPVNDQFMKNMTAAMTFSADDTDGADFAILDEDALRHLQGLVYTMRDMGADTDGRNALGVEPLRPYLERIASISTMDELTEYFCDADGMNLYDLQLARYTMDSPTSLDVPDVYTVYVLPVNVFSLGKVDAYNEAGEMAKGRLGVDMRVTDALQRLGYDEAEINRLLTDCYRFEIKLARCQPYTETTQSVEYLMEHSNVMTREELDETAGAYPLGQILDACGLGASDSFTVTEIPQLKEIGYLYTAENLEQIKAYLTVNTILLSANLLDETTYALAQTASGKKTDEEDTTADTAQTPEITAFLENSALYARFVTPYLSDAFQQIYVAHFCTEEQKADIRELVSRVKAAFRTVIEQADWMGEETRAEALGKLDAMGVHVLYPDTLTDYSALRFDDCHNLLDAVAAVNHFNRTKEAAYINQPVNRSNWDLTGIIKTTNVNAMYSPLDNSINILAGLLSTDDFYGVEKTEEENLARLGLIVGHEISHGFDTSGSEYDKNGHRRSWWTNEDKLAFDNRAQNLIRYYSGLTPVMRGTYINGTNVSGEAIADMGGMKCALEIAEEIPDFDYDAFFRSYTTLWREHDTFAHEMLQSSDVHPVSMLRVNVIVSQFEKFRQTYDVQPGDGMYVAPEDTILVW